MSTFLWRVLESTSVTTMSLSRAKNTVWLGWRQRDESRPAKHKNRNRVLHSRSNIFFQGGDTSRGSEEKLLSFKNVTVLQLHPKQNRNISNTDTVSISIISGNNWATIHRKIPTIIHFLIRSYWVHWDFLSEKMLLYWIIWIQYFCIHNLMWIHHMI